MEVNYSKLAELLDIRDFDYASSAKFKKLMEQKERNRELNIIYFERRNKLEKLNSTLNKHTDDLEICYSSDMSKTHDTVTPEVLEDPNHTKVNDLNKQLKNLKDASMRMKICF
jgi:16S rRNA C1402 (ribose-2'-O) methylase RsmI